MAPEPKVNVNFNQQCRHGIYVLFGIEPHCLLDIVDVVCNTIIKVPLPIRAQSIKLLREQKVK